MAGQERAPSTPARKAVAPTVLPWLIVLQLPALRPWFKLVPEALWPIPIAGLLGVGCGYWLLLRRASGPEWPAALHRRWLLAILLLGMACFAGLVYPLADSLRVAGRGSDQDDAILIGVAHFLQGTTPYEARTYLGNGLSPGPGWLLLWVPFVTAGAYWLATPVSLGVAALCLGQQRGWRVANLFLLLLASSLAFWELVAVGSDLVALGGALVIVVTQLRRPIGPVGGVVAGVILGCLATSRIVFLYLPAIVGLPLFRRQRPLGVTVFAAGTATSLGLHAYLASLSAAPYPPLHLVAKGAALLPIGAGVSLLLACAVLGVGMVRVPLGRLEHWLGVVGLSLGVPLGWVAVADLWIHRGGDLRTWEGATYLGPVLVLAAAVAALLLEPELGARRSAAGQPATPHEPRA